MRNGDIACADYGSGSSDWQLESELSVFKRCVWAINDDSALDVCVSLSLRLWNQ